MKLHRLPAIPRRLTLVAENGSVQQLQTADSGRMDAFDMMIPH